MGGSYLPGVPRDPQDKMPVKRCPVCGREVYGPGGCGYCPVRME